MRTPSATSDALISVIWSEKGELGNTAGDERPLRRVAEGKSATGDAKPRKRGLSMGDSLNVNEIACSRDELECILERRGEPGPCI